jgi:adenosine deaminase
MMLVFSVVHSEEYRLAASHFVLTKQDIIDLSHQAINVSFAAAEEQSRLHTHVECWADEI